MKLITLSQEKNENEFENYFKEDINLKPFSQLALLNLQFKFNPSQIIIDDSNNKFIYRLQIVQLYSHQIFYID